MFSAKALFIVANNVFTALQIIKSNLLLRMLFLAHFFGNMREICRFHNFFSAQATRAVSFRLETTILLRVIFYKYLRK